MFDFFFLPPTNSTKKCLSYSFTTGNGVLPWRCFCVCLLFLFSYLCPHSLCPGWAENGSISANTGGEVENSMALSYDLATACGLITAINRETQGESVSMWVGQSRTDNRRGLSNTLHSTLIWRTCGTNIKENIGFPGGGCKRTTRTLYIPAGPQFDSATLCSDSSGVGQRGWLRFDVNTLHCSLTYRWIPVMHYCHAPITARTWNAGQVNHSGNWNHPAPAAYSRKLLQCKHCSVPFSDESMNKWLMYSFLNKNFTSHICLLHLPNPS